MVLKTIGGRIDLFGDEGRTWDEEYICMICDIGWMASGGNSHLERNPFYVVLLGVGSFGLLFINTDMMGGHLAATDTANPEKGGSD